MANTLAHLGLQGIATRAVIPTADVKWIYLGAVIPDIPWILQRLVRTAVPGVDLYELRLYAIAQSSLVMCLLGAAALAALAVKPRIMLGILAANCALHLLFDAMQIKWGNGVHLLAPFSWELLTFDLFWPESLPTYVFTVLGLGFVLRYWLPAIHAPPGFARASGRRFGAAAALLAMYLLVPLAMREGPRGRDNHYVETLKNRSLRPGREVALDRVSYNAERAVVRTYLGDELRVAAIPVDHSAVVSVRGAFIDTQTIAVHEFHEHHPFMRDAASRLGLALIATIWVWSLLLARRQRRATALAPG